LGRRFNPPAYPRVIHEKRGNSLGIQAGRQNRGGTRRPATRAPIKSKEHPPPVKK
jgi:hypothetical protein